MAEDRNKHKKPRQRTEKKKIQDRLAQRANRERTKQRIAALEEALTNLKSGDDTSHTASLMRTIENLRSNNHRLHYTLDKIQSYLGQVTLVPETQLEANNTEYRPWAGIAAKKSPNVESPSPFITGFELGGAASAEKECCATAAPVDSGSDATMTITDAFTHVLEDDASHDGNGNENDFVKDIPQEEVCEIHANTFLPKDIAVNTSGLNDLNSDLQNNNASDIFEQTDLSTWHLRGASLRNLWPVTCDSTGGIVPDAEKWHCGNSAYFGALDSVKRRAKSATTMDFQTAFQAVLWGWQNVGPEAEHPVWSALRTVDQRIFGSWTSKAQRIAMMYVCQTLIQYRENPTSQNLSRVPGFLWPRPAQERIDHPVVIDFLIWPGMRDRLVFEHEKYNATGVFSAAYVQNFNFFWPHPDSDIFGYDLLHDRYEFSPLFLQYVYDFKNWTMKAPFFQSCPEMRYDVPAFEGTPFTVVPVAPVV